MSFLFLRKYRTSENVELFIEDIERLSVKELGENAASKLAIPLEELSKRVTQYLFFNWRWRLNLSWVYWASSL